MGGRVHIISSMETPRNSRSISKQIVYFSDEDCHELIDTEP
jgi:hypothetical protein